MRSSLDGGSSSGGFQTAVSRQRRRHALGQHHRRPVRGAGDAAERQRVVGVAAAADLAAGKLDVVGHHVELLGGDGLELVGHAARRHVRRHRRARREAAGVGAGGDRPLVLRGVHLQRHVDVVGRKPQLVGDDLRQHGLVALTLHGDVGGHRHCAERIDVDGHHRDRAVLRAGLVARLGREQRREIAHVGHRGLDHHGKADAVLPAGRARGVPALFQVVEPAVADRGLDRARIVAGIVERAGRGAIRKLVRRHEVAPDHVEMVEFQVRSRCAAPAAPAPDRAAGRRSRE